MDILGKETVTDESYPAEPQRNRRTRGILGAVELHHGNRRIESGSMRTSITRRSFLATSTAALAGLAATLRAADGPYRIGVETYCFHDVDLPTTLKHTRDLGLRYLELHDGHLPFKASRAELDAAKRMLADHGIDPVGVYIHDAFTADEAVARPIFDYAKTVGFSYITGGPKPESLPVLDRMVKAYGIQAAIHNHGPKSRYDTLEDVTSVLDAHPNLTAVVDIGHFARSRVDPARAIRAIGSRAIAVHVKDVDKAGENMVVGEGIIDMRGVFTALAETKFAGLLVLEYEGDFDNMDKRLAGMRKSLTNMHALIGDGR
jgi:inosose dehydratase